MLLRILFVFFKFDSRSESEYSVRDTITNAMSDTDDTVVAAPLLNSRRKSAEAQVVDLYHLPLHSEFGQSAKADLPSCRLE